MQTAMIGDAKFAQTPQRFVRCTGPQRADDRVALAQQLRGEIGAILAGDSGDERRHGSNPSAIGANSDGAADVMTGISSAAASRTIGEESFAPSPIKTPSIAYATRWMAADTTFQPSRPWR